LRKPHREAAEKVQRIIHLCREVEAKGFNPFEVDVKAELETLRSLLPFWVKPSQLRLDGEALSGLSRVVELQEEWVRVRSRLRILDPETVKAIIGELSIPKLAEAFLRAWTPTVRIEMITRERLREAASYWARLKPRSNQLEEWKPPEGGEAREAADVKSLGISLGEDFEEELQRVFRSLLEEAEKAGGEISYWDFVKEETFRETVATAYMVSFLATYGYVKLVFNPLTGEMKLKPTPETAGKPKSGSSVAIPLDKSLLGGLRVERGGKSRLRPQG